MNRAITGSGIKQIPLVGFNAFEDGMDSCFAKDHVRIAWVFLFNSKMV